MFHKDEMIQPARWVHRQHHVSDQQDARQQRAVIEELRALR